MKKTLACFLALLCLLTLLSCEKKEPETSAREPDPAPTGETFSPEIPEYRYISIYHYKKNAAGAYESLDDCVSYNVSEGDVHIAVWQELIREIESSAFVSTTGTFSFDEYYDINIYLAGEGISQYAMSFSENGVCDVEQQKCIVATGSFSFARLAEYFAILKG